MRTARSEGVPVQWGPISGGRGCPCILRSNASWVMITWDPQPLPSEQNNRQTRLKTLPSQHLRWRAVKFESRHFRITVWIDFSNQLLMCVLNTSDSICVWVWVWTAKWLVYGGITIWLFRNFDTFFIENIQIIKWQFGQTFQNKKNYIFECGWPNGNSNDLCVADLSFGCSHSNSNANVNWGIQNATLDISVGSRCA